MDPPLLSFKSNLTVEETTLIARNEKERISSTIVIVDAQGKPEGIIQVQDLLFAETGTPITALMNTDFPRFYADEPIEYIRNDSAWQVHPSLPVVDNSDALIGTLDFKTINENKLSREEQNKDLAETGNALGELYRIGLTGLLQSVGK